MKQAIRYIERAIEMKPEDPDALFLYGKMLIKDKDPALAVSKIEKAIEIFSRTGEE